MRYIDGFISVIIFLTLTTCGLTNARDSAEVQQERPVVLSYTNSPDIPDHIRFCGKNIDLRRYNIHEGIDRELTSMTYMHSSTMLLIKRANRWFPVIEPILRANNIPDDFKYLAVIESSLDPVAVSPARAVGIWQLLEGTARGYGLIITPTVDERRNVRRATQAACRYLQEAYDKFGDWMTVAVSYNSGMGRMSEQLDRQGEESPMQMYFLEETMRYPYRMLAAKILFENPYKYGFVLKAENLYKPVACDEEEVATDVPNLAVYAKERGISYLDLKLFNPWLRDTKLLTAGKRFTILIPQKNNLNYNTPNKYIHDSRWVVD